MKIQLQTRGLSVQFGGLKAVEGLDLDIFEGQIHALIGPNGAGKSTVVNVLSGFIKSTSGSIELGGVDVTGRPAYKIAKAGMARTFQNIRLFGSLTVLETVLVGAHRKYDFNLFNILFGRKQLLSFEKAMCERAIELLSFVGLSDISIYSRIATTLAYGHQRRVEIARALMSQPTLILLDEPMAGMNASEKEELADLIRKIKASGVTILLIEHDMEVIRSISDRVTVLCHGQKLSEGAVKMVFEDEKVHEAYFGKSTLRVRAAV